MPPLMSPCTVQAPKDDCLVKEGCLSGIGTRKVLFPVRMHHGRCTVHAWYVHGMCSTRACRVSRATGARLLDEGAEHRLCTLCDRAAERLRIWLQLLGRVCTHMQCATAFGHARHTLALILCPAIFNANSDCDTGIRINLEDRAQVVPQPAGRRLSSDPSSGPSSNGRWVGHNTSNGHYSGGKLYPGRKLEARTRMHIAAVCVCI